jgi:hypothetical protein
MNYTFIGREVANLTCKVHRRHPRVVQSGENIHIECCCEEFRAEIADKLPAIAKAYVQQTLSNFIKKQW